METFFRTYEYLVAHVQAPVRRQLMDEIQWNDRLIGIKGTRGVGKTTFLLQYAKEQFAGDRSCLYVNLNTFYFTKHRIFDFAKHFFEGGGRVLLFDQIFKYPDWSHDLRLIYDELPELKVVFTGCSVMPLDEDNPELNGLVKSYNLRGFSFREFLNLTRKRDYPSLTLEEILADPEKVTLEVLKDGDPLPAFRDYLHHGFYPFFLEKRNYSENLLKTMNMMIELDILFIKQIELKYLHRIKQLFYLLALNSEQSPNVSHLASEIDTSRATVMNYIKYLYDARLINLIYPRGQSFPKKPSRILLHNTNLACCIKQGQYGEEESITQEEINETFFMNTVMKDHWVSCGDRACSFWVDNELRFRLLDEVPAFDDPLGLVQRHIHVGSTHSVIPIVSNLAAPTGRCIPLWLLGFLY